MKTQSKVNARPYHADDVARSKHVIDGVLSPGGDFAIYVLSEREPGKTPDEDRQTSALWRVETNSGETRRLTAKSRTATSPRITPDGRAVLFLARADASSATAQIWRLPLDGGEAEPITSLEQGVGVFALSPDGLEVAFSAMEKAPAPPGPNDHVRIDRVAWRFDPVPGYLQDMGQAIHVAPSGGGEAERLTPFDGVVQALEWSPDGHEIAAVILGRAKNERGALMGDLCIVGRDGKQTILVSKTIIMAFFWTLGGGRIGFIGRAPDGALSAQPQLFIVAKTGGDPLSRTGELDLAVGGLIQAGSPSALARARIRATVDGSSAIASISRGGETGLWRIALDGPQSHELIVPGARTCKLFDLVGAKALFASEDFVTPAELWIADLDNGEQRAVTDHNSAWRAAVDWPRVERLTVKSAAGVEVEGWVMIPPGETPPFKTLLFIHGGPHAGWGASYNEDFLEMAGAGYAVAFANPRGSTGYGDSFSTSIVGCWANPEFEDFTAFLDELVGRGIAGADRLGVTGVSGGGHLSAWLIGHTDRFKAAVPEQGLYNMLSAYGVSDAGPELLPHELSGPPHEQFERYWSHSPIAYAHLCKTPTLLVQGENDVRCPMEQAEQLYTVLKLNGCEVELLRLRGCNHGLQVAGPPPLRRARMSAMRDWFDRHIP